MKTIDVHAHILSDETMGLLQKALPQLGVKHTPVDAEFGVFEVAGTAYRPFPRGGWDLDRRFQDMTASQPWHALLAAEDAVLAITHLQPRPMAYAAGLSGPKETWVGDSAMIWNPWEWRWRA